MCCPKCGNKRFGASQVCYHDVTVDETNEFIEDNGISESDKPYGIYTCTECGAEFDNLSELKEAKE